MKCKKISCEKKQQFISLVTVGAVEVNNSLFFGFSLAM
jgi:hypothetical protein